MQMTGRFRQDSPSVIFCASSGVDGDESKGIAFVHQAKFSFGIPFGAGVQVDSTFDEIAVKIGHQTANVSRLEPDALGVSASGYKPRDCIGSVIEQRIVDGVDGS